jgi:galactose-1-phosphate uridylyltransferase
MAATALFLKGGVVMSFPKLERIDTQVKELPELPERTIFGDILKEMDEYLEEMKKDMAIKEMEREVRVTDLDSFGNELDITVKAILEDWVYLTLIFPDNVQENMELYEKLTEKDLIGFIEEHVKNH